MLRCKVTLNALLILTAACSSVFAATVVQVAGGAWHSAFLKSDGTVWTCGSNYEGQLGDGSTDYTDKQAPVQVTGLTNVIHIAAGSEHTFAVKSDGTVWAWGGNTFGQFGDGTHSENSRTPMPVQVPGLSDVVSVATYSSRVVVLKSDGTVWAWGFGPVGDGTTANSYTPVQVMGLTHVTAIAAGHFSFAALKEDGTLWTWGGNSSGQIGDGTTVTRATPIQVPGLSGVKAIAAGYCHIVALKVDGTVWAWGANYSGQIGDGTSDIYTCRPSPIQVSGLSQVVAVGAGQSHSVAVKSDGTVWAWGANSSNELGDGTTTQRTRPVQVQGLTGVASVAAGWDHTLAIRSDGTACGWGRNNDGQLGYRRDYSPVPIQSPWVTDVVAVAAGSCHNLALTVSDSTPEVSLNLT